MAPGYTCFAPASVEENGKHHAFAWNIGTTGRITSAAVSWRDACTVRAWIASERCENSTPFGRPVVPLV